MRMKCNALRFKGLTEVFAKVFEEIVDDIASKIFEAFVDVSRQFVQSLFNSLMRPVSSHEFSDAAVS
jgi:hypothetical protein